MVSRDLMLKFGIMLSQYACCLHRIEEIVSECWVRLQSLVWPIM